MLDMEMCGRVPCLGKLSKRPRAPRGLPLSAGCLCGSDAEEPPVICEVGEVGSQGGPGWGEWYSPD